MKVRQITSLDAAHEAVARYQEAHETHSLANWTLTGQWAAHITDGGCKSCRNSGTYARKVIALEQEMMARRKPSGGSAAASQALFELMFTDHIPKTDTRTPADIRNGVPR